MICIWPYRKSKAEVHTRGRATNDSSGRSDVMGMPGLYRTIMTFGIILVLGSVIFYLLTALNANIVTIGSYVASPSGAMANVTASLTQINHELTQQLTTISTILGGAVASIIGFYFGNRAAESSAKTTGKLTEEAEERGKAESKDGSNKGTAGGVSPLKVIGAYPAKNQQSVKRSTSILETFDQHIDSATLNNTTFDVRIEGSNTREPGTVRVLPEDERIIMFDPTADLEPNTYILTISKNLKSVNQNELGHNETWSFKTGP